MAGPESALAVYNIRPLCLVAPSTVLRARSLLPPHLLLQFGTVRDTMTQPATDGTSLQKAAFARSGVLNRKQELGDPSLSASCRFGHTHFCFASMSRYFRSRSVWSEVLWLIKVVAIPVFPDRPVRPISCT